MELNYNCEDSVISRQTTFMVKFKELLVTWERLPLSLFFDGVWDFRDFTSFGFSYFQYTEG